MKAGLQGEGSPSDRADVGDNWTLQALLAQESELQLERFDNDHAWRLGAALVQEAKQRDLPVVVDIARSLQQVFHAALPGTSADNDAWITRKARVVARFGHSSLYMSRSCSQAGTTLHERFALPMADYAAFGGAFPLRVRHAGTVGVVTVSGLPDTEDHRLVVEVLRAFLARER